SPGPTRRFTWSERRLAKRGSFSPGSPSAAEVDRVTTRRAANNARHTTCLDIAPRRLLMAERAFCGHRRHAVETAIRDRYPQAPGSDRDSDDGAFRLQSQPRR